MEPVNFNPELIAGLVGLIVSLLFSKFPILRTKFAALTAEAKSGIMIGLMFLVSLVIFLLALYGVIETVGPISWLRLIIVFFVTVLSNQTTYLMTPESADVRGLKATARLIENKAVTPEETKAVKDNLTVGKGGTGLQ